MGNEMKIDYKSYHRNYHDELKSMIQSLYLEDPECHEMTDEKIEQTIRFLDSHPDMGKIVLFFNSTILVGYSILIHSWSNEYGGMVCLLDELFVNKEWRGNKIATGFIQFLINSDYNHSVVILLEVMHSNTRALKLYKRLGFESTARNHLIFHNNN
jgi:GNAT superfamily N-acetyltransferase